jgi:alpha-N-arabinofuranosidase
VALTADDIHAYNSFDSPRALEPASVPVQAQGGRLVHRFPAASVNRLQLTLA